MHHLSGRNRFAAFVPHDQYPYDAIDYARFDDFPTGASSHYRANRAAPADRRLLETVTGGQSVCIAENTRTVPCNKPNITNKRIADIVLNFAGVARA